MSEEIKNTVIDKYSQIVDSDTNCGCNCNCGTDFKFVDGSTGFSHDYSLLEGYSKDADYALGCGIPTGFINIKKGDRVVDLGAGAGNDAFVARSLVGDEGKVIGIDMTSAMISKAKENNTKLGYNNVEFILGDIEKIPLSDESADVVLSNCVLNLVPNKQKAFSEVYRILNSTGKFSISDIVINGNLPDKLRKSAELYVGCVAGAIDKNEYLNIIKESGFSKVEIVEEKKYKIPDDMVKQILDKEEFSVYKSDKIEILSITVYGEK